MPLNCITRSNKKLPKIITDTSTLKISLDNQGMATLSISILTRNNKPITSSSYCFKLTRSQTFKGFIETDNSRKLDGSEYYEHSITARGTICGARGGSRVAS